MVKRSEMTEEARVAAREAAKRRYAKYRDSHARRCYVRLLELGQIKRPRAATIERWGLEQLEDGSWRKDTPCVACKATTEGPCVA
jgi:hypothetical protein